MAPRQRKVWDNDLEMLFLKQYHSEDVLWDSKHPHYKNKIKICDAWKRLSSYMNIEINELKRKKDSLHSSYRFYRKKVRDSTRSGEEIYKPIWFAYAFMDSFLSEGSVRRSTETLNENQNDEGLLSQENGEEKENAKPTKRQRKNPPELQEAEYFIKESLPSPNQELPSRYTSQENEDDCDRYGKILANKLRKLPEDERLIFMYEIDGMFVQRIRNRLSSTAHVSSPSHPSNTLHTRNRPESSLTTYSEPISTYDESHESALIKSEPTELHNHQT